MPNEIIDDDANSDFGPDVVAEEEPSAEDEDDDAFEKAEVDDDIVEEAEAVVEDIVGMFTDDNSTLEEVMEELDEFLGTSTELESSSETTSGEDPPESTTTTDAPQASPPPVSSPPITRVDTTVAPTLEPTSSTRETFQPAQGETERNDDGNNNNENSNYYHNNGPGGSVPPGSTTSTTTTTPTTTTTIFATLLCVAAMIFTAWQMSDNPDGIFAALCRLILTSLQLLVRMACRPCRKICTCCYPDHHHPHHGGFHEPYGAVSTMDYGYKDPALELS